jgi:hypothetical protein
MLRRLRSVLALALCTGAVLLATAVPAGAQQLVDAGGEGDGSGGLAFVLFTVMVALCAGAMFYMDHVRRRRLQREDDTPKP